MRPEIIASVIADGDASLAALLKVGLPLLQFLGGMPLMAAQLGNHRHHPGVDAGHQSIGLLAFGVPAQQPAGAAGQIGDVRAPLMVDQVEAGAQAVPALLERHDAGVAGTDLERDRAGGKCFL